MVRCGTYFGQRETVFPDRCRELVSPSVNSRRAARRAAYEARSVQIPPGGALLLFTDGLTDSIPGTDPEKRLFDALANPSQRTIAAIQSLTDQSLIHDDLTMLLVKRSGSASA